MADNEAKYADLIIVSGNFLQNHSTFTDQDPYILFEYNEKRTFKTTVKKSAGLNATWNERFRISPILSPNII